MSDGIPKCTYCKNPATRNMQKVWIEWNIDENGYYSLDHELKLGFGEPTGDENIHYCEECYNNQFL